MTEKRKQAISSSILYELLIDLPNGSMTEEEKAIALDSIMKVVKESLNEALAADIESEPLNQYYKGEHISFFVNERIIHTETTEL